MIVGDMSEGWRTLWKENPDGSYKWKPKDHIGLWLKAAIEDPENLLVPLGNRLAVSCHCRFCAKELTDFPSVEAGYGPYCAKKHGLPWG